MEESGFSINLLAAKNEYTKILTGYLIPLITEGFISMYDESQSEIELKKKLKDQRYTDYSELQIFQDKLRKIPKWNQDLIDTETKRIIISSKCKCFEKLLSAIFISNINVLSTIRIQPIKGLLKIKVPKLKSFIHKCYIECSRELYKVAYLFDNEDITNIEKQKNIRDINKIVKNGIIEAVRKLLPIHDILKSCIGDIGSDIESDNDEEDTDSKQTEKMFQKFANNTKLREGIKQIHSEDELEENEQDDDQDGDQEDDQDDDQDDDQEDDQEDSDQEESEEHLVKEKSIVREQPVVVKELVKERSIVREQPVVVKELVKEQSIVREQPVVVKELVNEQNRELSIQHKKNKSSIIRNRDKKNMLRQREDTSNRYNNDNNDNNLFDDGLEYNNDLHI